MASIQGKQVWNSVASTATFDSYEDANRAYKLLCDYEALVEQAVAEGKLVVKDSTPVNLKAQVFE